MPTAPVSMPMILIDPKKYRMRFYKSLLQELGSPKYIHLMVNPETKMIAVRSIPNEQPGCIAINSHLWSDNCYEIYSCSLTQQLFKTLGWTDMNVSYRLKGKVLPTGKTAVFSPDSVELVVSEG